MDACYKTETVLAIELTEMNQTSPWVFALWECPLPDINNHMCLKQMQLLDPIGTALIPTSSWCRSRGLWGERGHSAC